MKGSDWSALRVELESRFRVVTCKAPPHLRLHHGLSMATIKPIEGRSVHQIQSGQVIVDLNSVAKGI